MPDNLIAPMPVLPLTFGSRIVAEAIDPTDGSPVTGVAISDFTLYGIDTANVAGPPPPDFTPPSVDGAYLPAETSDV